MIRGGKINLSILGPCRPEKGDPQPDDPGKMVKGMGGAVDLVAGVKGRSCSWSTWPGIGRLDRPEDPAPVHAAADRRGRGQPHHHRPGVMDVTPEGLKLVELAPA